MHPIYEILHLECSDIITFGEALSDILYENKLSQSHFANMVGYSDSVVSRLINDQEFPRWITYQQIARIAHLLDCNANQTGLLISAFICTLMTKRGLYDEQL